MKLKQNLDRLGYVTWVFGNNPKQKTTIYTWVFPKIVVPQNGWFIMENTIKMDDLGVPLFLETPTSVFPNRRNF